MALSLQNIASEAIGAPGDDSRKTPQQKTHFTPIWKKEMIT